MNDDLELLQDYARNRSDDAFRTVLERYVNLVYGVALRQVGNRHVAEEITQAVFLILARKAGSLRSGTALGGWLFRTTRFVAVRALRDEARRQERERQAAQMGKLSSSSTDVLWEEVAPRLDEALAQLGESDRVAILLRFFQQKELAELGRVLGTTENTASKRVSRALEKLRVFLARRGAVVTATALATLLTENAVQATPAGLTAATFAAVTATAAGSATTLLLVKAALKSMFYAKASVVGVSSIAGLALITTGTLLAQRTSEKGFVLPTEVGQTVAIEIQGLPAGAKKLEFVVVPGLGPVKPFLIGKYEVTQGQYEAVMHKNPSVYKKGPDYPVEQVTWQDAKDFCSQLKKVLPDEMRDKISFRLPTDEDWSIAARLPQEPGGSPREKSGKIQKVYPWGSDWPPPTNAGNYAEALGLGLLGTNATNAGRSVSYDGFKDTAPVGSYPPNAAGLYDVGGNVWEWVEDWLDEEENIRTIRGAGFYTRTEKELNSSYRGRAPVMTTPMSGFRVRLEAAGP